MQGLQAQARFPLHQLEAFGVVPLDHRREAADVLVRRPQVAETTALGAAYAAGLAVGFWADLDELSSNWAAHTTWEPSMGSDERNRLFDRWEQAVERTLNWV